MYILFFNTREHKKTIALVLGEVNCIAGNPFMKRGFSLYIIVDLLNFEPFWMNIKFKKERKKTSKQTSHKNMRSGVRLLGLNLALLCASRVTLGKLLNLGVLFLSYKMGRCCHQLQSCCKNQGDDAGHLLRSGAEALEPDCQGSDSVSTSFKSHDLGQVIDPHFPSIFFHLEMGKITKLCRD